MTLLNRTTRRVAVTADGAAYYAPVVRLLADMDDAEISLPDASRVPRGRLRVDVPSPLARPILMPALPAFHARYPDIQLHMGANDRQIDLIAEHVDCVIRGGGIDPSLVARHVGDLQAGVYAAQSYLARLGTPAHPRELEATAHRTVGFMRWDDGVPWPLVMQRDGEQIQVQGRDAVACDDGNAYLAPGLAGMGVVVAAVHGACAAEPRRARAGSHRLVSGADAIVDRVPAQPAREYEGACLHRLGDRADAGACAGDYTADAMTVAARHRRPMPADPVQIGRAHV